jgi:hypothetical protein
MSGHLENIKTSMSKKAKLNNEEEVKEVQTKEDHYKTPNKNIKNINEDNENDILLSLDAMLSSCKENGIINK